MPTGVHKKIRRAEAGDLPTAIMRLASGWLVAGDVQPLRGYCVLMADPVAKDFNFLSEPARAQYAIDMGRVGDALIATLGAYRINYETWGNLDPALHTHIVPRYQTEDPALRVQTPRQAYDWDQSPKFDLAVDEVWMKQVRNFLKDLG